MVEGIVYLISARSFSGSDYGGDKHACIDYIVEWVQRSGHERDDIQSVEN